MHAHASIERVHRKVVWGRRARVAALLLCAAVLPASCSDSIRTGQSNSYLVITTLQGLKGGGSNANTPDVNLDSDVITLVPALTGTPTIFGDTGTASFQLVRNQAKTEAPLAALAHNNAVISTIAEVTFYGHDQSGRDVSVSGRLDINFANWGD